MYPGAHSYVHIGRPFAPPKRPCARRWHRGILTYSGILSNLLADADRFRLQREYVLLGPSFAPLQADLQVYSQEAPPLHWNALFRC